MVSLFKSSSLLLGDKRDTESTTIALNANKMGNNKSYSPIADKVQCKISWQRLGKGDVLVCGTNQESRLNEAEAVKD